MTRLLLKLRMARAVAASTASLALIGTLVGCAHSAAPQARSLVASSTQLSTVPAISTKPIVYIASPYSKGDPAINTHFQCQVFDQLMNDGVVWPVAPLWSHFQHTMFPRKYEDWVAYDRAMIPRYDACLRLNSEDPKLNYTETKSSGADNEVAEFQRLAKPVFYSIADLYAWAKNRQP